MLRSVTSILIFSSYTHAFARGPTTATATASLLHRLSLATTKAPPTSAAFLLASGHAFSSSPSFSTTSLQSTSTSTSVPMSSPPPAVSVPPQTSPVESQETLNPIDDTCTVLVVGATRGIGLDFLKQCLQRGATVVATYRSDVPSVLQELKSSTSTEDEDKSRLHFLKMDLASEESIQTAATEYKEQIAASTRTPFTHIIHNAGIYLTGSSFDGTARGPRQAAPPVTKEIMMKTFEINTIAPLLVAQNFASLTSKRSDVLLPVLSFVSSKVGSVDDNGSGGAYAYRSSKSALNNIAKSLSIDLAGEISVVLLHPGYVRTDMTSGNGLIDADESVSGMLKAIEATDGTVGFRFVDYKACLIPW